MKKSILGIFTLSALLMSCESATLTDQDENSTDSSTTIVEVVHADIETGLAFDGVQKGNFTLYGHEDVTGDEAVSQEDMFATFNETGAFNGKVKVNINEVCQKMGCWINFKKTEDENVMVFFRDHFNIPIDESAGKEAVLYGNLEADTLSVDFQKHLLDDAAEAGEEIAQAEYDAITEEKIDVSFDCISILIK